MTATTSRPFCFVGTVERPAAHLDPYELDRGIGPALRTLDPEFHRLRLAERGRIRQRRKIGRAIGDMHAVEQAVSHQLAHAHAEQCVCAAGETNSTAPFLPWRVMTSVMLRASRR